MLISSNFTPIIKNLPPEEKEEIQRELMNNNLGRLNFTSNLGDSTFLDKFVQFYFENGRFPGNVRLIILPRTILPDEIKNTKPIKLRILFEMFQMTDAKALLSLQALCALLLNLTDDSQAKDVALSAMNEFFENLTAASLNENNPNRQPKFVALKKLSLLLYQHFKAVNLKSISKAQNNAFKIKNEMSKYKEDMTPVRAEIVNVNEYSLPLPGPLPTNNTVKEEKFKIDKETLEIALPTAKQNLKATREANEDDKQNIISSITDLTAGAVVRDYFDDDNQNEQFITNTDKPLK